MNASKRTEGYTNTVPTISLSMIAVSLLFSVTSLGAVRMLPRTDYTQSNDRQSAFKTLIDKIKGTSSALLDQGTLTLGGDRDLLIQLSTDQKRVEIFSCPTMKTCLDPQKGSSSTTARQSWDAQVIPTCMSKQELWSCKQIYSSPVDRFCSDYKESRQKKVLEDALINEVLGTLVTSPIKVLNSGIGMYTLLATGMVDKYERYQDGKNSGCDQQKLTEVLSRSKDQNVTLVEEPNQYYTQAMVRTFGSRNANGTVIDQSGKCAEHSDIDRLGMGGESRTVIFELNKVQPNGSINYRANNLDFNGCEDRRINHDMGNVGGKN